jgi:hypothetical protein
MIAHQSSVSHLASMYDAYVRAGFALVPISHGKGPTGTGWNERHNCITRLDQIDYSKGYGLAHAYSSPTTCALDIDSWPDAVNSLMAHGVNLTDLTQSPDCVMIDSGNPGHATLLYQLPFGLTLPSKKISIDDRTIYELRCATANNKTVQDVLPSAALHPKTNSPYRWAGNGHFSKIPIIPMPLLALWHSMLAQESLPAAPTEAVSADWDEIKSLLSTSAPTAPARNGSPWVWLCTTLARTPTRPTRL